jgi:hypothetical protein
MPWREITGVIVKAKIEDGFGIFDKFGQFGRDYAAYVDFGEKKFTFSLTRFGPEERRSLRAAIQGGINDEIARRYLGKHNSPE